MDNKTININNETLFLGKASENNPYKGYLSDLYDMQHLSNERNRKYISSKDLTKLKGDLRRSELKKEFDEFILNKSLSEKLLILNFIKNGLIDPEKKSQTLYFEFNTETGEMFNLDDDNFGRIESLIGGAPYFSEQIGELVKNKLRTGYLKITIKKNPENNELYIEGIDAVKDKNS
ncbi:hypothetical protein M0P65_06240 [Candidatus Gracilibacteria bacterium]|nr:hypothetical protein [Candidatus Gracilibacteria bacterium]